MAYSNILILSFMSSLPFLYLVQAQQSRTPHGLEFENPMSFAPSAYEFFHPRNVPGAPVPAVPALPGTSSMARADAVRATLWSVPPRSQGVGAGGVAAIVIGFVFVVLVSMAAVYVVVRRRANSLRGKTMIQPDA